MQFVQIAVNLPESHSRQVIGPLSPGLNAIYGQRGSGKSRLVSWLRQVTADHYGSTYLPPTRVGLDLAGEVDLSNYGSPIRLSRDLAGRINATRPTINEYPYDSRFASGRASTRELTARQRQAFALLADVGGLSDTEIALDEIARRLGLETCLKESRAGEREQLVNRERDLVNRLDLLPRSSLSREELINRRRDIEHKLDALRQLWGQRNQSGQLDRQRLLDRSATIETDLHNAEAEIQQLDSETAKIKNELKHAELGHQTVDIEPSYRQQLQQLEDRLTRWRKTLRDLKSHRETVERDESETQLDQQMGEQLSGSLHSDPRAPLRSLEAQLHQARKQLDQLIYQYWPTAETRLSHGTPFADPRGTAFSTDSRAAELRALDPRNLPGGYQVQRDAHGRTHIIYDANTSPFPDTTQLPEVLRSMQRELSEICHQLSRREAATTAFALKQQAQQLRRCETELLQSVERLIEERGMLLRKIADRYSLTAEQVSLTFGDWCQCNDHPHLYDWLLQEEAPRRITREADGELRSRLQESLIRLDAQRRQAALRAEDCRRQLRDIQRSRPSSPSQPIKDDRQAEEADSLRELDILARQLADLESRDRLVAELDEVRRLLKHATPAVMTSSEYTTAVERNIVALSKSLYHHSSAAHSRHLTSRHYDNINGVVIEQPTLRHQYEVPSAIVHTAKRLAIGQLLANRGDTIPVLLDQTLDGLDERLQQSAIAHLALASQRLQIILLTDNSYVADLVRQYQGVVFMLQESPLAKQDRDINRDLIAYANDEEAAKWYHPAFDPLPRRSMRQFFLEQNSSIEQHPGLHADIAAKCRVLGITSIGELLNVDPTWLAENLRISRVDPSRVRNWQAVADLLTSVRNLRPFDARVLVGAGVRSVSDLSTMNPQVLVDNVERFLATDLGHKILQTGNSFEYSRIRNWISAARSSSQIHSQRGEESETSQRSERHEHSERSERSERVYPAVVSKGRARSARQSSSRYGGQSAKHTSGNGSVAKKFYLELTSPVADAPSIADRMAERLNAVGVYSVEQLISANPDSLAPKLNALKMNNRKVSGETIRIWQDQARLVCRIPFLRGHDAQLLVACGITTPETLRSVPAEDLFSKVSGFAKSSEGQRILRGGKVPDLAEVQDWIDWSSHSRSLNAA